MSKTKVAGYLLLVASVLKIAVDALNGGSFDIGGHFNEFMGALQGAGLVFLRDAMQKVHDAVSK